MIPISLFPYKQRLMELICVFFWGILQIGKFVAVLTTKAFHTAGRVHQLLFTSVKRMTHWTYFHVEILFRCRVDFHLVSADTTNCNFMIFGVDTFFHQSLPNYWFIDSRNSRFVFVRLSLSSRNSMESITFSGWSSCLSSQTRWSTKSSSRSSSFLVAERLISRHG